VDPTSFVELGTGDAESKHLDIEWTVDFDATKLTGRVDFTCHSRGVGPTTFTLDSRNLDIGGVFLQQVDGQFLPAQYIIDKAQSNATLGTPILITLPDSEKLGQEYIVRVEYSTTRSSSALQWLTAEQTSSKEYPFMFSQCQAIHARSLLPCQDLCAVKVTYTATVHSPSNLTALMSAVRDNQQSTPTTTRFTQSVPIPPYLIAIVCGELDSRKIGPRSTVWAEPSIVDRAAWEFADTERMIDIAESLCGPYRFGVYDMLVLPPSFPYGGMENPCLTFVTPTLLAGDRSQVSVIAHELAHSWSGNLVTNQTWEHFWINEGLTVFTEKKIIAKIFGNEAASIRGQEGWDHLKQYVDDIGATHPYTRLCPPIKRGEDPDDSFSVVPYEKGASFFWFLESLCGAHEFEEFIIKFFNHFAFKTVTSEDLKIFACHHFPHLEQAVGWDAWFNEPGMPSYKPPVDMAAILEAQSLGTEWISNPGRSVSPEEAIAVQNWPSGKKCILIRSPMRRKEYFGTCQSV